MCYSSFQSALLRNFFDCDVAAPPVILPSSWKKPIHKHQPRAAGHKQRSGAG
jgi:hypothetical protein